MKFHWARIIGCLILFGLIPYIVDFLELWFEFSLDELLFSVLLEPFSFGFWVVFILAVFIAYAFQRLSLTIKEFGA